MKKILIFIVMMICAQTGFATDFKTMAEKMRSINGVTVMDLNGQMLKDMMQSQKDKIGDLTDAIESGFIIVCENSSKKDKNKFDSILQELDTEGYEDLINIEKDNSGVRISIGKENDQINKLLIIARDEEECVIMQANGKFKPEDISRMKNGIKQTND